MATACTGLRDQDAVQTGFEPLAVESTVWDHKAYYPGAHEILLRVTGDRRTGHRLGAPTTFSALSCSPPTRRAIVEDG